MTDRLFLTLVKARVSDLKTIRKDLQAAGIRTKFIDNAIEVMEKELQTEEIASMEL